MNDQETPPRTEADGSDRRDERTQWSDDETAGGSWLHLIDVGLVWLLPSILVALVSMGVFWAMEFYEKINIDPMRPPPPLELGWVVAGGVGVGLAFMAGAYGWRREAKREWVLQVACTLFLCGAFVAWAVALVLLDASGG
jgi:hypothetical protein